MKLKNIIIISLSIIFTMGCTDLEEIPEGTLSPESFYKSKSDFEAATIGIYRNLFGAWSGFDFHNAFLMCAGSEDVTSRPVAPELKQYDEFRINPTYYIHNNLWTALYAAVNNANTLIASIGNLEEEATQEEADAFEGQARFLRALSYFYLVRWFGEVPIITSENQSTADQVGQSPVSDIYEIIVDDLEKAENMLPTSFLDAGKATKGAAIALLAKVYLTMTGWPIEDASYYSLARDKAAELITGELENRYSLENDFADLWLVANKTSSSEWIFAFQGTGASGSSYATKYHHATRPGEEGGWSDFMSEARFFNAFPDGYRKEVSFHTVFGPDSVQWQDAVYSQPYIAKYRDGGRSCGPDDFSCSGSTGDFLCPVLRYADVLLIYAEAANMAEGSPSAAALEAINKVRRRANKLDPNTPDASVDLAGMSQSNFDDAVIAERNWELAFENNRWFDLVRKKMVVEVNKDLYPHVTEDSRLLPKPALEVDLIEGLEQNPGY